jgi:protein subunit release factor A
MNSVLIEIRAAEGGDDAKLLVLEQLKAYYAAANKNCL